jgi:cytochrome c biogenesis protein CcmG/thiol:disulfide interchange protein DsbE
LSPAANTRRRPARSGASPARKSPPPSRTSASRTSTTKAAPKRRFPIALVGGAVLAAGLVAVIVLSVGSGTSQAALEIGTPTVTGDTLPAFDSESTAPDPAIGLPIPEVAGADFNGNPVTIADDGRPKMIVFMAHWCEVCQVEIPTIAAWLPTATIPDGVDLYSVSTAVDPAYGNYPPSQWLKRVGWTIPVIADDQQGSVAAAFGLTAFPYFVFVNADGTVAMRIVGRQSTDTIAGLLYVVAS